MKSEPDLLLAISPDGNVEVLSGRPRPLPARVFRQLISLSEATLATGRQAQFRFTRGRGPSAHQFEVTLMPVQAPPVLAVIRDVTSHLRAHAGVTSVRRNLLRLSQALALSSRRLVEHDDFEHALREITESAAKALSVRQAGIWLVDESWESIICRDQFDTSTGKHSRGLVLRAGAYPKYFESLKLDRAISAADALTDPRTSEFAESYLIPLGIGAMLDSPIRRFGRMGGILCLEHAGGPRPWTTEEEVFSASMADMVALILDEEDHRFMLSRLEREAYEDSLTGLSNRRALLKRIEESLPRWQRSSERAALLIAGIDRLNSINEALGHAAGDRLLVEAARCLLASVRASDMVARIGGDQFAVLLEAVHSHESVLSLAHRIQDLIHMPVDIDGRKIQVSASMGIVYSDEPSATTPKDMLRCASIATTRAIQRGGGRIEIFKPSMHANALQRLNLEDEMRQGLDRGEFEPYLQPIVSLGDGALVSFEALLRWRHPSGQVLAPGTFLAAAEESGLCVPIGWSTLRQVCSWIKTVQSTTGTPIHVSYNLSQRQFQLPDLLENMASIVHAANVDPSLIQIEVTETVVSTYSETANRLAALKAHGFSLAVDDFGTGYSSLSLLHSFPLDILKIDRSFIARMDSGGIEIVRAIVALAQALGMKVVAEGIETLQQARQVSELGCEFGQGFWLGRPMDVHAAASLLIHRTAHANSWSQFETQESPLPELAQVN
ncbi:MAG: sensor domain-containing phosphodiesterase [Acidobacteriota bacterium]